MIHVYPAVLFSLLLNVKRNHFFLNSDGDAVYLSPDNVICRLNYGFFTGMCPSSARDLVKALNFAYARGFEKDRFEWKSV